MSIDLVWFCRPLRTVGNGGSWKREWRRMVVRAHCDRDPLLKLTDGVAECDTPSSFSPFITILKNWIIFCRIGPEYGHQMPWLTVLALRLIPSIQNWFEGVCSYESFQFFCFWKALTSKRPCTLVANPITNLGWTWSPVVLKSSC